MKKLLVIVVVVNFFFIAGIALRGFREKPPGESNINNEIVEPEKPKPEEPQPEPEPEVKKYEPKWTNYPPKGNRTSGKCDIWIDVMNHASGSESYSGNGPCTEVHETLHGICKRESNKYGIYCMDDKMVWVEDLNTTLNTVANNVPKSLRGRTYNLYLRQQQQYFNSEPIYIFDEWIAYAGGTACAIDMTESQGWTQQRWDTVLFMREFDVYALTLAMTVKPEDEQFKNMLGWQLERSAKLYKEARKHPNLTHKWQDEYMEKWKTSSDAEGLRQSTRDYLGEEWTKRVLGF